ncbi:MAG: exodeoxyribonuclease V subunit alpha [Zoogloeaceae bacterium]|jgi:exodeoxyribonuclease V alpha subunit|nr:exodeoxyribonuclease V subunit alpha [Zoogloeaceae bacterium]
MENPAPDFSPESGSLLFAHAFADQCQRWAQQAGAPKTAIAAVARAGHLLALKNAEGHLCWPLPPEEAEYWRTQLAASGIVGNAHPLCLSHDRLWLARHFTTRQRLAAALVARHRQPMPAPGEAAQTTLRQLFADAPEGDGQALAAAVALDQRLVIVSGGPGTGKTATVAKILACLLADTPDLRIALAAPTGKAAARIEESIGKAAATLPPSLAAPLLRVEAQTLHRLLGLRPDGGKPRHYSENPLPVDVLVVDEASMLDPESALALCDALPAAARLLLLGDRHQLQSVEAGAVFAALSRQTGFSENCRATLARRLGWSPTAIPAIPDAPKTNFPLRDAVVWLTRSHRFDSTSALGQLASALACGDLSGVARILDAGDAAARLEETLNFPEIRAGFAPYRAALSQWHGTADKTATLTEIFRAFSAFRVLCAVRQGEHGVESLNARLETAFAPGFNRKTAVLFPGQPLLILKNDPATRLANGDVGIALEDAAGIGVWFPEGADFRRVAPARLPPWESAYAMTAHKSQGSEFERVALVLPQQDAPILSRELVYTALTRARKGIHIFGSRPLFLQAAARPTQRDGDLFAD